MSISLLKNLADDDLVDKNTLRSSHSTYRTAVSDQTAKPATMNGAPNNAIADSKQSNGDSRFQESESVRLGPAVSPTAQSPTFLNNAESPKALDYAAASPPPQDVKTNGTNGQAPAGKAMSVPGSTAHSEVPASFHTAPEGGTARPGLGDEQSVRSGSIQTASPPEIPPSAVGTFATGAATSGPRAPPDPDLHSRATIAESNVEGGILRRLTKREGKDAKRMSKILKKEAVTEQRSLDVALKELERLQKVQRKSAAAESEALVRHTKAARQENKLNQLYLTAKAKWEQSAAYLKSSTEALEQSREHARNQTELLREKTAEVDRLRAQKATDDRERQAKISALNSPGR
ncbi:hypothetical protein CALCODRAFT_495596 [Calocera cornea HHB12733]|uniref:Uncharacterized protein n=1 Tax=Calocera cornea HHB12733 TaxID=1353952 RepID=A0A165GDL1_9BASI|nr:hypothetical protein CALCODRAFT_495596 [Calocera cornea HHB12733]